MKPGHGAGEDDGFLPRMQPEDVLQDAEFLFRSILDRLLEVVGLQGQAGGGVLAGLAAQVLPGIPRLLYWSTDFRARLLAT